MEDLQQRINHYNERYEEVGTCDYDKSYIKVIDVGRKIITNRISGFCLFCFVLFCFYVLFCFKTNFIHLSFFSGFVLSRILCFIMNLHSIPRPIYLCRHGESEYNVLDQLGGDPHLSDKVFIYNIYSLDIEEYINITNHSNNNSPFFLTSFLPFLPPSFLPSFPGEIIRSQTLRFRAQTIRCRRFKCMDKHYEENHRNFHLYSKQMCSIC